MKKCKKITVAALAAAALTSLALSAAACTPHEHSYESGWTKVDDTYHWHAPVCGDTAEGKDKSAHRWDGGVVTVPATATEEGVKTYTCTDCGATKTEPVAVEELPEPTYSLINGGEYAVNFAAADFAEFKEAEGESANGIGNAKYLLSEDGSEMLVAAPFSIAEAEARKAESVGFKINGESFGGATYYTGFAFSDDGVKTAAQVFGQDYDGCGIIVCEVQNYKRYEDYTYGAYIKTGSEITDSGAIFAERAEKFAIEAETANVTAYAASGNLGFGSSFDASGFFGTGYVMNPSGYTFEYDVTAERATTVYLNVRGARNDNNAASEFITDIAVNGSESAVTERRPFTSVTGSSGWYDWKEYPVAALKLEKGKNVISVTFGFNLNIDQLVFVSKDAVALTSEIEHGHAFTDWTVTKMPTETEEGRALRYCGYCKTKEERALPKIADGIYTVTHTEAQGKQAGFDVYRCDDIAFTVYGAVPDEAQKVSLYAKDSQFSGEGVNAIALEATQNIDGIKLMSLGNKRGTMSFDFNVGEDAATEFILDICRYKKSNAAEVQYIGWLTFILDGKYVALNDSLTIAPSAAAWNELAPTVLFTENLAAGNHNLTIIANGCANGCFLGVSFRSEAEIGWKPVKAELVSAKSVYKDGDEFDLSGVVLKITDAGGYEKKITEGFTSDKTVLAVGDAEVCIDYKGFTVKIPVTVTEDIVELTGIKVTAFPSYIKYIAGETLDISGLKVVAVYSDESLNTEIFDFDYDLKSPLQTSDSLVTLTYSADGNEYTCTFGISVEEASVASEFEAECVSVTGYGKSTAFGAEYAAEQQGYGGMGYLAGTEGTEYELKIYSPQATQAHMVISGARGNAVWTVDSIINGLSLNGGDNKAVATTDSVTFSGGWFGWTEFTVGTLWLSEGENTISFTSAKNVNYDKIIFKSCVALTLAAEKENGHSYSEWTVTKMPTESEEGRAYRYCPVCKGKEVVTLPVLSENAYQISITAANGNVAGFADYTVNGITFRVYGEPTAETTEYAFSAAQATVDAYGSNPVKARDDGSGYDTGSCLGSFTYDFTVSKDATVEFMIDLCKYNGKIQYLYWFEFYLDGKAVAINDLLTVEAGSNWTTEEKVSLFITNLTEGNHTLTIVSKGAKTGIFCGITLKASDGEITLTEDSAE